MSAGRACDSVPLRHGEATIGCGVRALRPAPCGAQRRRSGMLCVVVSAQ